MDRLFHLAQAVAILSDTTEPSMIDHWTNSVRELSAHTMATPFGIVVTGPSHDDPYNWYIFLLNNSHQWRCLITGGQVLPAGYSVDEKIKEDAQTVKASLRKLLRYLLTSPDSPGFLKEILARSQEKLFEKLD